MVDYDLFASILEKSKEGYIESGDHLDERTIELFIKHGIGNIKQLFKKEVFHVFKFRSDSDTLGDDLKNKWLIGWSSNEGGTFSNFDEYALYEKNTIDATLKNIKKKLIG